MSVVEPSVVPAPAPVRASTAAPAAAAPEAPSPVAPLDERVFAVMAPAGAASPAAPAQAPALATPPAPAPAAPRVGVDWLTWSMTSLVLTAFFVLIVSGRVVTEGPVLLVLSATHGIHEGDLYALTAACAAIALPVLRGLRRR